MSLPDQQTRLCLPYQSQRPWCRLPGPEYSLRRSARLAAKASEPQVYATDPNFWTIDERTDKRDLNPEPAAEARLHLSPQSRTSPFDDVEVANSRPTREGWGLTL